MRKPTLKDALHNLHPDARSDPRYARGVLVGAVAALMATGLDFPAAFAEVSESLPERVDPAAVPNGWEKELEPWTTTWAATV